MKTLAIALRNLLRNRRRSLTTLLAMTIGLGAILVFGGYSRNAILAMQTGYVQLHGHLQIQHKDYFQYGSGNPAAYGIAAYPRLIERIRQDAVLAPLMTVITPKLQLGGIAGNFSAGLSKNVLASGVIVDDQNRMRDWDDYGSASYTPRFALAGTADNAVLIGTGVARLLQLCAPLHVPDCHTPARPKPAQTDASVPALPAEVAGLAEEESSQAGKHSSPPGAAIEMLAANVHGAPNVASLQVIKAENWGFKEFDDNYMVMHLPQAQRLIFGQGQAEVSAIQIQLQHTSQIPFAQARLEQLLKEEFPGLPLAVLDFATLTPLYVQTIQFFDSMFGFIAILIGVIVLFTIGNTMSMAIVERTTEIGTLRAIGQRQSGILRLFIAEGALLGVLGAGLGIVSALCIAWIINHSGLSWTPPGYVYAYPLKVRIWGDPGLILGSAGGLILVALLSAWWPARRAARLPIVDALRHI